MYDRESTYLTWGGQIGSSGGGQDVWQCGVHFAHKTGTAAPRIPVVGEMQSVYTNQLVPFHSADGTQISTGAILKWAKCVQLKTDGHYLGEAVYYEGTPTPGHNANGTDGPQSSIVLTLYSGQSLGQANYGRIYLPWFCGLSQPQDGLVTAASIGYLLVEAETLMQGLNEWGGGIWTNDVQLSIMSRIGTGKTKQVKLLKIGNVKDTQRRRRNRLKESYSVIGVPSLA